MTTTPKRVINDKSVSALKARSARYDVPDSEVRGLVIRVRPDGVKTWTLRYELHGKGRRVTLGEYGPDRLSLAEARKKANKLLVQVDDGKDPVAEQQEAARKAAQAKRDSIEALCESYIEKHAKKRKRSWRADQGTIKREILPVLGKNRPVTSITRRDCRMLVQKIADRPAPIFANRTAALLSRLFRFAVDEEMIELNIAAKLPKPGVEKSARPKDESAPDKYSDDEIRQIWTATEQLDPAPRAIYRLGLATGLRPGEIAAMRWDWIDGSWMTVPGSIMKNNRAHRTFLTSLALAALAHVPKIDGEPMIFRGFRGKRQLAACNRLVFAGVRRRQSPRHALRKVVASGMAACGVKVEDVSRVLSHSVGLPVTAIYTEHQFDKEKKSALLRWERRLRAILAENADVDRVVPFTASRA
jgi:integrase